jgi:hypothetical protein
MKRTLALLLFLTSLAVPAHAYKEPVHVEISRIAFDRMTVDLLSKTGFDRNTVVDGSSLRTLVVQGSWDQDAGLNALNHFYDPTAGAGLSVPVTGCLNVGQSARVWAAVGVDNPHSTPSARTYLERALMLQTKEARKQALGSAFSALGQSIHLVQDMAQPEHTRNDQHLIGSQLLFDDAPEASLYEEWALANLVAPAAVSYDGYPNVSLPSTLDYFGDGSSRGLAQFANANYVTQDTNYDDEMRAGKCYYHPGAPRLDAAAPRTQIVDEAVLDAAGNTSTETVIERIYTSFPRDFYQPTSDTDPNHTFLSAVDLETREITGPKFSLADQSYLSRAALLIPRAVGYSAGYLDHFFRGSVSVQWAPVPDSTPKRYNITVTNTSTEPIRTGALITIAYVAGTKYLRTGSNDMATILEANIALAPGASHTFTDHIIPYLRDDDDIRAFERHVVVRGTIGEEANDIITLVQPKERTENGIRARITWDNPASTAHVFVISDTHNVWNTTIHTSCDNWHVIDIPGTTMNGLEIGETGPIYFRMPSPPPDLELRFVMWLNQTYVDCRLRPAPVPAPLNIRLELYENGQFITEENHFVTYDDQNDGFPYHFGEYPDVP